jgi:hypothetical protein
MEIYSTGQMKAQSISIQLSAREKCNAGCMACISRTTPGSVEDNKNIHVCSQGRLEVGLNYARSLGATHAIITGKADPLQETEEDLISVIKLARKYVPLVDLHTNGLLLQPGKSKIGFLSKLAQAGLTMITYSISSFDEEKNRRFMKINQDPEYLIGHARCYELLVRCSLLIHKQGVKNFDETFGYLQSAGNCGAHMVVIREVWTPDRYGISNDEVSNWSLENKIEIKGLEEKFAQEARDKTCAYGITLRDPLPWGTPVYAVGGIFSRKNHGLNVTFARCEEGTRGPVIKSIVHKPDGHGYRNWDHNGDILY